MRIRSQIVAALVPLFVGLSLVTGGVMYYLQSKELEWGLHEEASSIAVVTARFLDGETISRIMAGNVPNENVCNLLRQITLSGRARRLTVFAAQDLKQLLDVTTSNSVSRAFRVLPSTATQLAVQPFVIGSIEKGKEGSRYLTTYASIRNSNGDLAGILASETTADILQSRRGELFQSLLVSITSSALLGLLLALVISTLITRKLANITKAVSSVEAGFYDHKATAGIIDELNDLENTFDTMRSVLKEAVSKIWRTIIETEQFRTKEDLVCAFKNKFQSPVHETIYNVEISGTLLGCKTTGSFFEIQKKQNCGYAVVGQVARAECMTQAENASAALAFITQITKNDDIPPTLKTASHLFDFIRCKFVTWEPSSPEVVVWSLDPESGQWHKDGSTLHAEATLTLHTMDTAIDRRIQTYAHEFRLLPQETLMKEVCMIVDEKLDGALLLIRRCISEQAREKT